MAKYIDAYAAEKALFNRMVMTGYQSTVIDVIRYLPREDVKPVKRGKWVPSGIFRDMAKCSVCGRMEHSMDYVISQGFAGCPYCLAEIDLEVTNES